MNGTIEIEMADLEIPLDDIEIDRPIEGVQSFTPRSTEHPPPSHGSEPEQPTTLHFAVQIERSLVSVLWHHPQFLDLARHELDFSVHISVPAYRKIIDALIIVYGELGLDLDFPCVTQCIVDMDALEECGGLLGLDQIFTDGGYYPEGRHRPEPIIREYIRVVKEYAVARQVNPFTAVRHFTRGRGFLQRNKMATRPSHPSVIGRIERCCCGKRCLLTGWPGEEDVINLSLDLER